MEEKLDIEGQSLDIVEAEFLNVKQSTIRAVEAGTAELQQVCALSIDSEKAEITQGAIGFVKSNELNMNQCISGVSTGEKTEINFSLCPFALSRDKAEIKRSATGLIIGSNVEVKNSASVIVIGKNIEGNITTLFDWKSALAVTAVAGGIYGLLRLFLKK
ncbi:MULTISPECIES: hypothetical protein [Thermodesulfovibrio]|uniref:Uncharacterized protein n=2 Tax=Thermodesulfovibrio yellowstonii TaxID=28262 RepID=B5YKF8_THEYD|nr:MULTISPECIES: hypothetical protein [Thermodesulfovibrio]ACI21281.1 hypothetical protein THEYE_A0885 [Thermodesulfovibrio yellowstonii DSM 11347]MDI6865729.1 hypothetical protein [Thermodesulfovibrio yellowstonii]GLI53429.1 hypothetical protein TISLANDTSLP1_11220 [Thermodesulfovibrio islandicus]